MLGRAALEISSEEESPIVGESGDTWRERWTIGTGIIQARRMHVDWERWQGKAGPGIEYTSDFNA